MTILTDLSRSLYLSALLARQRVDETWVAMDLLADTLLMQGAELSTAENSETAKRVFTEAARLMAKLKAPVGTRTKTIRVADWKRRIDSMPRSHRRH